VIKRKKQDLATQSTNLQIPYHHFQLFEDDFENHQCSYSSKYITSSSIASSMSFSKSKRNSRKIEKQKEAHHTRENL
jgi:hypothetical protein